MTEVPAATTRVVRLRRQQGVVVQDCDVYIGRRIVRGGWELATSPWANPFSVQQFGGNAARAVAAYRIYLSNKPALLARLPELRGKRLGCWCAPGPCHGDVLVALVNALPLPIEENEEHPVSILQQ
jgi:hypothetical protein